MKRFASQYLITNTGPLLKRAVVTAADDGTILQIEDTGGDLREQHSVEFHNGIIIPGFVNCHCHLELSHMKGAIPQGGGLGSFIEQVRGARDLPSDIVAESAIAADKEMINGGVSLCADICNTTETFALKKESRIKYINLLEVFGIDPDKAFRRMEELTKLSENAGKMDLEFSLVPHSVYSMSVPLLKMLKEKSGHNKVTSIHFMETEGERTLLEDHSGPIMNSYQKSGLTPARLETVKNHSDAVLNEITRSGNLILVHNTFADLVTVRTVMGRKNLFWCLCPNSNYYIEKSLPPVPLLLDEGCEIVIGTDSLASNSRLDILEELITLQLNFPSLSIEDLVSWSTVNGARALGKDDMFGKIEPGKNPGLLLLQNVDLQNMKLLPGSKVTRLA